MVIKREAFVRYNEKKAVDSFSIRLNKEEREVLESSKKIIEQTKDSTALKKLAWIGANVIHDRKERYILGVIFANKRMNKRSGIVDFD